MIVQRLLTRLGTTRVKSAQIKQDKNCSVVLSLSMEDGDIIEISSAHGLQLSWQVDKGSSYRDSCRVLVSGKTVPVGLDELDLPTRIWDADSPDGRILNVS